MGTQNFKLWNRVCSLAALVVSAVTYILTVEPTASFWDCGEFIASSYKLEVGHPPGNPVFQLIARFFTLFGDNMHAALLVNILSALCSAFTIYFLYLTIVFFTKRLVKSGNVAAICGSALVGSLAYCFSDTFWFSAVEGEVYAMSSLFTAIVFWAMTKWYEQAHEPNSGRWIVFISLMMGLSIGVHLLNLLAVPALVFMYFYRQREDKPFTVWEFVKIFLLGAVILGVLVFLFIPYLPKIAAYFDLFFVNVLGLPYNVGAAFFVIGLLAACFWGLFATLKKGKALMNTVLLCVTSLIIGFSIFSFDVIRSCAKTPTNEYQPDNAFTLVRYLSREQYGSAPLVYGQYYDAPYDVENSRYWAPLDGKYKKVDGPAKPKYKSEGKMLFPRMWATDGDGKYEKFYGAYTRGKGTKVAGSNTRKPTMGANLHFFFDYQLNWMYWRYFMWNFVGRQNDIHSPDPGDIFHGNWESGITFLDKIRLGDQSDAPALLSENKGKNHYFFLPLILGIIGLCFQFRKDKRGCWLVFLMFFMTGIAIVMYLNQPPHQPRERDYAFAGSFYFFSIWIGFAVAAIVSWVDELLKGKHQRLSGVAVSALCLFVPVLMAAQNWDDHDRSNRRTSVELAKNYLNSVEKNGYIVTHGDNDTFPLWYAQEVEGFRTDVRVLNTSLLGTDWYIDQMKYAINDAAPIPLSIEKDQYLYGTNEWAPILDTRNEVMDIKDVIKLFKHPSVKATIGRGKKVDYIASRKIRVPVNRQNVIDSGIMDARYADQIPDSIVLVIPEEKEYLTKPEIFMLDLLSNYEWDRPLQLLSHGGDINIGIKDYLSYEGYSYKFVPVKSLQTDDDLGFIDSEKLYDKMCNKYCWDALAADDYFVDYQNLFTHTGVMSVRNIFFTAASAFDLAGQKERALEMLDKCQQILDPNRYPIETIPAGLVSNDYSVISMVDAYYKLGEREKGHALAKSLLRELSSTASFYDGFYSVSKSELEYSLKYMYILGDVLQQAGDGELATECMAKVSLLLGTE